MKGALIRARGLVKRYGRKLALAGLDLTLERPEIVAILGPDGAGKTTLLRALAGLLEIEAEEATVLGHDLLSDVTALKAKIGYVPQAFGLHRDLSVSENLRFTARLHRIPEAEFGRRANQLLERTGLAPFADRRAGALSGGMKQKLAVANALLPAPDLLILDEPTAGVDVVARAEIREMLARERSRALVLMSTSYLDEAAASDRILYLDRGRLVAAGAPPALRRATPLELYRVWSEDPRATAREARRLVYVEGARATGRFARVEVSARRSPGAPRVLRDLHALPGADLVEQAPVDMEATLAALARRSQTAAAEEPSFAPA